jgi:hypothetical protein
MNNKLFSRVHVNNPPPKLLPSAFLKLESSCVSAHWQMSSSDEEAPSPELGASISKAPVTPLPCTPDDDAEPDAASMESSSHDEEEDGDEPVKANRTFKKDIRVWSLIARYSKVDHDTEDIKHQLFTECKRHMEASRLFWTTTSKQGRHDIFLWKWTSEWKTAMGAVRYE